MNKIPENGSLLKHLSAWLPVAMSLTALAFVLTYAAVFGIVKQPDERTPARIFQLIMAAQVPIAAYFAFKWLPKRPIQAILVLALQAVAWLVPILTVIWLESL